MNKFQRLTTTIEGGVTDRIPVALWRHWQGDDQRARDLAQSIVEFQRRYDWDFVCLTPSANFLVNDYGLTDEWRGTKDGSRAISNQIIEKSIHWTELRRLDPLRGMLNRQMECVQLVRDAFPDDDTPLIQVIYSPLTQAQQIAGTSTLLRHMRTEPDRFKSGLATLTESTLRFIDKLYKQRIDGILYIIEGANYDLFSEAEYRTFGMPYDLKIMQELPNSWWLRILQLSGDSPMFHLFADYPATVLNWDTRCNDPDLPKGKSMFRGAVCGGLDNNTDLELGTPASISDVVRELRQETASRRFILSGNGFAPITTPESNYRAIRRSIE